ncbi:D-amino-acid transaminase [Gracilibacillus sp. YIM 98692]|uniref:D-amino-acid transaminase n=1 Tax=Gracilibacillus sp. YIM 98692 TaxID=2663532 RepID=UPI0013D780D0|nr:D-amino-acid transaminase [Gracilibacillus sp. YIM 98692]
MEKYLIWNGKFLDKDNRDGLISFEDRGYQFGDGVYEVIRIYSGKIHLLEWHLDRLFYSMNEIGIIPPFTREGITDQLKELITRNQFREDGNIYLQVTRGAQERDHIYVENLDAIYYVKIDQVDRPNEWIENGVTVTLQEDIRWARCDIKSLNLLPNVMARTNAQRKGFNEALFYKNGIVRECGASNFFMVKNKTLVTHPANHSILGGITRKKVLDIARELEIPVEEREIKKEELEKADECFLTATSLEIVPILKIDEISINEERIGTLTKKLQKNYTEKIPESLT